VRRFFVTPDNLNENQAVHLDGDEFHHLKNVCRLEEGERVELLDGEGRIALAVINQIGKKSATLDIEKIDKLSPMPFPHVKIILCVPRFQKMDLIIQKCVELGATEILPVVSDRSFVKSLSKDLTVKVKRWEKIAGEACKQSGRAWPMKISEFSTLAKASELAKADESLFLYEGDGVLNIKSALEKKQASTLETLTLFIGAEGGFSTTEVENFKKLGFQPVTMGSLVLRVETACIAILSVIQYHFGLMR